MPLVRPSLILPTLEECAAVQGYRVRRRKAWWVLPGGERVLPQIAGGAGVALDHALGAVQSGSGVTSVSMHPSNAVPAGDVVISYVTMGINGAAITFADTGSNTYVPADSASPDGSSTQAIAAATVITPLATSDSLSASYTGTVSSHFDIAAASFTGLTTTAYASNAVRPASSTQPAISTSASVNAGDLVVALIGNLGSPPTTNSQGAGGWAALNTTTDFLRAAYVITSSAGTVTYQPTLSFAASPPMMIVAFQAAPASGKPYVISQAVMRAATR